MVEQTHLNKLSKDKFVLIFNIPHILRTLNAKDPVQSKLFSLDSFQFSLYDFKLPSIQVPQKEVHYGQQTINITSYDKPTYPAQVFNFEVDNQFRNYWVMWKWLQLLHDTVDASYGGKRIFPGGIPPQFVDLEINYTSTIKAKILDEYNNEKATVTYTHAFPVEIGELDFNYRTADQLTSNVTMVYNQVDISLAIND